jgi:polysaccharide chain length determinant protein (PEP-CTERM system associated)
VNEIFSRLYGLARAMWRRRRFGLAAAWLCALAIWGFALSLPDRYQASARVFVDTRTTLNPVLEGIAVEGGTGSSLTRVREALLSRPQLEKVVEKTGLLQGAKSAEARDVLVTVLQRQIEVVSETPDAPGGRTNNAIYTISYQHEVPAKGVEVVGALLDNFVEGTRSGDRSEAGQAQTFVNTQLGELEKRLQESEQALAEFRKQNIGLIPGERGDYFSRIDQEMTALQTAENNIAVATSRRAELQRQLAGARAYVPGTSGSGGGAVAGAAPDVTVRRQEAEQRLEDLQLRFTERHPEVVALRQIVVELRDREVRELAELQRGGAGTGAIRSLSANPVYQQIQSQINQASVDLASIQGATEQHREELARLRRLVDRAPDIEREYARLTREYTVTRQQFDRVVQRREQARISDDAASAGFARFEVLDPPRAASDPVWPKRQLLIFAGLLAALAAGVAAMLLPHLLSPTFDDTASLERDLELPVIGAVTAVRQPNDAVIRRQDIRRLVFACVSLFAMAALLMAVGGPVMRVIRAAFA